MWQPHWLVILTLQNSLACVWMSQIQPHRICIGIVIAQMLVITWLRNSTLLTLLFALIVQTNSNAVLILHNKHLRSTQQQTLPTLQLNWPVQLIQQTSHVLARMWLMQLLWPGTGTAIALNQVTTLQKNSFSLTLHFASIVQTSSDAVLMLISNPLM